MSMTYQELIQYCDKIGFEVVKADYLHYISTLPNNARRSEIDIDTVASLIELFTNENFKSKTAYNIQTYIASLVYFGTSTSVSLLDQIMLDFEWLYEKLYPNLDINDNLLNSLSSPIVDTDKSLKITIGNTPLYIYLPSIEYILNTIEFVVEDKNYENNKQAIDKVCIDIEQSISTIQKRLLEFARLVYYDYEFPSMYTYDLVSNRHKNIDYTKVNTIILLYPYKNYMIDKENTPSIFMDRNKFIDFVYSQNVNN